VEQTSSGKSGGSKAAAVASAQAKSTSRMSFKDQRELEELPKTMAKLQGNVEKLEAQLANPELYAKNPDKYAKVTEELETARLALAGAEERWIELEMKREQLAGGK
jgi:ATP-binding cassette subfamily F protein uup